MKTSTMFTSLALIILRALRRMKVTLIKSLRICIMPITTFKDIREEPDFAGPLFLMLLCVAFSVLQYNFVFSKVLKEEGGSLVGVIKLENVIHILLAWRVFSLIMVWILLFALMWGLIRAFGGDVDSYTLFSAVGYVFTVQLLLSIVDLIFISFTLSQMPNVIIVPLSEVKSEVQANLGIDILFSVYRERLVVKRVYHWFFNLWSLVLYSVIAYSVGRVNWVKSIIIGVIAYSAVMLISVFVGF